MKKLLFDLFPVAIFFIVYKFPENFPFMKVGPLENAEPIILATAVLVPATLFQLVYSYWRTRKIEKMYLVTFFLVLILGGATVIFANKAFIQWKPTIVNWLFAAVFLGSQFIGKKNMLERMMGGQISLPALVWRRLNYIWIMFFVFTGALNLLIAFSGYFTEDDWVNFKFYGLFLLTLVFIVIQGVYISRHAQDPEPEQPKPE
jgi:intracellular septation protein